MIPEPIDEERLGGLVAALPLEEKVTLLTGRDSWTLHPLPRIGLRSLVLSDGPAGVRGEIWDERSPSVSFPSPTAVAASWNRDNARAVGLGLGSEARRKGVDAVLGPTINLQRTPFGGRHFEAFSEDPVLTAELAAAYIEGVQSVGVGATAKHYVANDSETERFTVDVQIDDRTLRELYLLAFEAPVVEAKAWVVMSAYNSINGTTASENLLLTTPLTDEWGFDGVVVSDWTAVRSLESARQRQDLVMPGPSDVWGDQLVAAVLAGDIDEKVIDEKVLRLLRLAARVGALEGFVRQEQRSPVGDDETRAIARSAAVEGTVLLRNDGILPLTDSPRSIAVIGEGATLARIQGGGSATVVPSAVVSPLDGVIARWPDAVVTTSKGAVVHRVVAELPAGSFRTPSGEAGILVRCFDGEGAELSRERREASSLVWFGGNSLAPEVAVVELDLELDVPSGPAGSAVPFAIAGSADYEIEIGGIVHASGGLRPGDDDDFSAVVLNPPWASVPLPRPSDGSTLALTVRFRPDGGEMPGAFAVKVGTSESDDDPTLLIAEAARAAAAAELAIVVVGTSSEVESEGFDRDSLALPGVQDALVDAVLDANPNTVVVVNSGAPVLLPWSDRARAVIATWFPGQEFGHALATVLAGDDEPGGRLPVTWPARQDDVPVREVQPTDGVLVYREGVSIGYRAWDQSGAVPAFAFGHGLGYTRWELESMRDDAAVADSVAEVVVRNTGAREGKVVVQLYAERLDDSAIERPAKWLIAFSAQRLAAGESRTVRLPTPWRGFANWIDGSWQVEPGRYRVWAGFASNDLRVAQERTFA